MARYGSYKFNKTNFLAILPYIRQRIFIGSIIAAGFKCINIILFNPKKVLLYLYFLEDINPNEIAYK